MHKFFFSAAIGTLALAHPALAERAEQNVRCDVGDCTLKEDPEFFLYDRGRGIVKAGFHVIDIKNADDGPNAGTFNMISDFALGDNGKLLVSFRGSGPDHYTGDLFLTVYYPSSVAGTSININEYATEGRTNFEKVKSQFDLDLSAAVGQTIFYEIQGTVDRDKLQPDGIKDGPRFALTIWEKD